MGSRFSPDLSFGLSGRLLALGALLVSLSLPLFLFHSLFPVSYSFIPCESGRVGTQRSAVPVTVCPFTFFISLTLSSLSLSFLPPSFSLSALLFSPPLLPASEISGALLSFKKNNKKGGVGF